MIHLFTKVANYLLGDDDSSEEELSNTHNPILQIKEPQQLECKEFEGKVTALEYGHGLIDESIYFPFDACLGGIIPALGDVVIVTAKRKHKDAGWKAECVSLKSEWEGQINEEHKTKNKRYNAVITSLTAEHIILNHDIRHLLSDVQLSYEAFLGDWVSVNEQTNIQIQPLRVKDFKGEISGLQSSNGFIDKEIFFRMRACIGNYLPKRRDCVTGKAIECKPGPGGCSWRAIELMAVREDSTRMTALENIQYLQSPSQSKILDELLQNKLGILIQAKVDFGTMYMDEDKCLKCSIRNDSMEPVELDSCKFYGDTQFTAEISNGIVIQSSDVHQVSLKCHARNLGNEKQLMIFDFKRFKIGRHVTVSVLPTYHKILEASQPYIRNKSHNKLNSLSQAKSETWLVKGQRPRRAPVSIPNRLPQYPVPDILQKYVLNKMDVAELVQELNQPLSLDNYTRKLQACLHIEEIQQYIDIREFDMEKVSLDPFGEFLSLSVPGLAEGRPSLLVGDSVILSQPSLTASGPEYEGIIHEVMKDLILLKFQEEFHTCYRREEYNVRFTFNRTPLRRCHVAAEFSPNLGQKVLFPETLSVKPSQINNSPLKLVSNTKQRVVTMSPLATGVRKCPLGRKKLGNSKSQKQFEFFNKLLNSRQRAAVLHILNGESRPTPYILYGPPGTGKTITLVEAILQVFTHISASRILVCTPSNSAADLLTERLHNSGHISEGFMVRLNAFHRKLDSIPESIQQYCNDGEDLLIVSSYRIIIATCTSIGMMYSLNVPAGHFTHAFIDESGQATEPECLIPIGLVANGDGQIVLAGDPKQLGPVLRSQLSQKYGLGQSLLERLCSRDLYLRNEVKFADHGCYDPLLVTKLVENYRSHPALLKVPSELFYHNELRMSGDPEITSCLEQWDMLPNHKNFPMLFHGVRGEDMREGNSPSWFNAVEVVQVVRYLKALLDNPSRNISVNDIGIITPYRKQVEKIRMMIVKLNMEMVKVGSVEEFQGQERLAIIISTVRSNEGNVNTDLHHNLGFLSNQKRFNVAITRAQALLVVVGNPHLLAQDPYWKHLLKYCVEHNSYIGCDLPYLGDLCIHSYENGDESSVMTNNPTMGQNNSENTDGLHSISPVQGSEECIGIDSQELCLKESNPVIKSNLQASNESSIEKVEERTMNDTNMLTAESTTIASTIANFNFRKSINKSCGDDIVLEKSELKTVTPNNADEVKSNSHLGGSCDVNSLCEVKLDNENDLHRDISDNNDGLNIYRISLVESNDDFLESKHSAIGRDSDLKANISILADDCINQDTLNSDINRQNSRLITTSTPKQIMGKIVTEPSTHCFKPKAINDDSSEPCTSWAKWGSKQHKSLSKTASDNLAPNVIKEESESLNNQKTRNSSSSESSHYSINTSSVLDDLQDVLEELENNICQSEASSQLIELSGVSEKIGSFDISGNKIDNFDSDDSSSATKEKLSQSDYASTLEGEAGNRSLDNLPSCSGEELDQEFNVDTQNLSPRLTDSSRNPVEDCRPPVCNSSDDLVIEGESTNLIGTNVQTLLFDSLKEIQSFPSISKKRRKLKGIRRLHKCKNEPSNGLPASKDVQKSIGDIEAIKGPTYLQWQIMRQIEYYFGDYNLSKDKFLLDIMQKNNGYVPLETLTKFKKLANLSTCNQTILEALKYSDTHLTESSEDGLFLRRSSTHPLPDYGGTWKQDLKHRSVYVEGLDKNASLQDLERFFANWGSTEHIEFVSRKKALEACDIVVIFEDKAFAEHLINDKNVVYNDTHHLICYLRHDIFKFLYGGPGRSGLPYAHKVRAYEDSSSRKPTQAVYSRDKRHDFTRETVKQATFHGSIRNKVAIKFTDKDGEREDRDLNQDVVRPSNSKSSWGHVSLQRTRGIGAPFTHPAQALEKKALKLDTLLKSSPSYDSTGGKKEDRYTYISTIHEIGGRSRYIDFNDNPMQNKIGVYEVKNNEVIGNEVDFDISVPKNRSSDTEENKKDLDEGIHSKVHNSPYHTSQKIMECEQNTQQNYFECDYDDLFQDEEDVVVEEDNL